MHVISFMNYPKLLKSAIEKGGQFLGSDSGETPLALALKRKNKICAEIIIKRIPKMIYTHKLSSFEYLGDILSLLNKSSSKSLNLLYNACFPIVSQYLPRFGRLKSRPPIVLLSDNPIINTENFLQSKIDDELIDVEIEFRQSLLRLDLGLGSDEGISFINSLVSCKNLEVFRSGLVKVILLYK